MPDYRDQSQLDARYKGLAIPIRKQVGKPLGTAFTREIIRSSIAMILGTRIGERVMLPTFGSNLALLVFEPNDDLLTSMAQRYIVDALTQWEPRIQLVNTRILTNDNTINVLVEYVIKQTNDLDAANLVFERRTAS